MLPKAHILLGIPFSLICLYLFPQIGWIGASIIWLSSFLIDVDHYIYYAFAKKSLSLPKAYRWHKLQRSKLKLLSRKEKLKHKHEIIFLHGFEILVLIYLLSFLWKPFIYILVGFIFHLLADIYEEIVEGHRIDKVSLIHDIIKYKKLKNEL